MHEGYAVFASWSNFYVIMGSSAAALTGLMFVVVTLATGGPRRQRDEMHVGFAVFNTPTVMHFCTAFLVSGILSAPWRSTLFPDVIIGIIGFSGALYVLRVIFRANRLNTYEPDLEDWAWFGILPLLAYAAMTAASILLSWHTEAALFTLAAAVILLIFIGIRNAWDIVIYLSLERAQKP